MNLILKSLLLIPLLLLFQCKSDHPHEPVSIAVEEELVLFTSSHHLPLDFPIDHFYGEPYGLLPVSSSLQKELAKAFPLHKGHSPRFYNLTVYWTHKHCYLSKDSHVFYEESSKTLIYIGSDPNEADTLKRFALEANYDDRPHTIPLSTAIYTSPASPDTIAALRENTHPKLKTHIVSFPENNYNKWPVPSSTVETKITHKSPEHSFALHSSCKSMGPDLDRMIAKEIKLNFSYNKRTRLSSNIRLAISPDKSDTHVLGISHDKSTIFWATTHSSTHLENMGKLVQADAIPIALKEAIQKEKIPLEYQLSATVSPSTAQKIKAQQASDTKIISSPNPRTADAIFAEPLEFGYLPQSVQLNDKQLTARGSYSAIHRLSEEVKSWESNEKRFRSRIEESPEIQSITNFQCIPNLRKASNSSLPEKDSSSTLISKIQIGRYPEWAAISTSFKNQKSSIESNNRIHHQLTESTYSHKYKILEQTLTIVHSIDDISKNYFNISALENSPFFTRYPPGEPAPSIDPNLISKRYMTPHDFPERRLGIKQNNTGGLIDLTSHFKKLGVKIPPPGKISYLPVTSTVLADNLAPSEQTKIRDYIEDILGTVFEQMTFLLEVYDTETKKLIDIKTISLHQPLSINLGFESLGLNIFHKAKTFDEFSLEFSVEDAHEFIEDIELKDLPKIQFTTKEGRTVNLRASVLTIPAPYPY